MGPRPPVETAALLGYRGVASTSSPDQGWGSGAEIIGRNSHVLGI